MRRDYFSERFRKEMKHFSVDMLRNHLSLSPSPTARTQEVEEVRGQTREDRFLRNNKIAWLG